MKKNLLISIFLFSTMASAEEFIVLRNDCTMKSRDGSRAWVTSTKKIPIGSTVYGKSNPKNPDVVVFKTSASSKTTYAVKKSCMFESESATGPSESRTASIMRRVKTPNQKTLGFGLFTWKENIDLILPDTTRRAFYATIIGLSVGGTYEWMWQRFQINALVRGFFGQAEAAKQGDTPVALDKIRNITIVGGVLGPEFLWRPESGLISVGASVPLIVRYGNFPEVQSKDGGSYKFDSKFTYFPAVLATLRIERKPLLIAQEVGFYRSLKSLLWSIQVSYVY